MNCKKKKTLMFLVIEVNVRVSVCCLLLYRLRELHTLKGHVESVVKLKGLDIETAGHYTV